jgi:hypothetical protein
MPVLPLHRVRDHLTFKNYSENRADYLAFIAQGWHLVMFGTPLFDGIIYGGQDGRLVLHTIETPTIGNAPIFAPLDKDRSDLLDMIASHYQLRSDEDLADFVFAEMQLLVYPVTAGLRHKLASASLLNEIPATLLKARFRAKLEAEMPTAGQLPAQKPNPLPDMLDRKPASDL